VFVIDDVKPRRDGPVRGYGGKMVTGKIAGCIAPMLTAVIGVA
jgi:hypothetical protein